MLAFSCEGYKGVSQSAGHHIANNKLMTDVIGKTDEAAGKFSINLLGEYNIGGDEWEIRITSYNVCYTKLLRITGHGGFFKQAYAGQRIMSSALNAAVNVMETAGEGGPWGMAVLAAYMMHKKDESLADYLSDKVFADAKVSSVEPEKEDVEGFNRFLEHYQQSLTVEKAAAQSFK